MQAMELCVHRTFQNRSDMLVMHKIVKKWLHTRHLKSRYWLKCGTFAAGFQTGPFNYAVNFPVQLNNDDIVEQSIWLILYQLNKYTWKDLDCKNLKNRGAIHWIQRRYVKDPKSCSHMRNSGQLVAWSPPRTGKRCRVNVFCSCMRDKESSIGDSPRKTLRFPALLDEGDWRRRAVALPVGMHEENHPGWKVATTPMGGKP
jgi:hypothetical protein